MELRGLQLLEDRLHAFSGAVATHLQRGDLEDLWVEGSEQRLGESDGPIEVVGGGAGGAAPMRRSRSGTKSSTPAPGSACTNRPAMIMVSAESPPPSKMHSSVSIWSDIDAWKARSVAMEPSRIDVIAW